MHAFTSIQCKLQFTAFFNYITLKIRTIFIIHISFLSNNWTQHFSKNDKKIYISVSQLEEKPKHKNDDRPPQSLKTFVGYSYAYWQKGNSFRQNVISFFEDKKKKKALLTLSSMHQIIQASMKYAGISVVSELYISRRFSNNDSITKINWNEIDIYYFQKKRVGMLLNRPFPNVIYW